jgi:hypothetical protein
MNKQKCFMLALCVALLATSCRKQDFMYEQPAAAASEWKSISAWSAATEGSNTTYSAAINDKGITADVVANGLVLVFMKTANGVESLPFQQQGNTFWYYQVAENNIEMNAGVTGNAKPEGQPSFAYFILTAEKLKSLEEKGHSAASLMSLTYENAAALLK